MTMALSSDKIKADQAEKKEQPSVSKRDTIPQSPPKPDAVPKAVYALVVDDEPANRDFLVRLLQQAKLKVEGAGTGADAIEIAKKLGDELGLVMLDRKLPDMTGIEVLKELRPLLPHAKIVMATMFDERSMIREAFELGCDAFLVKPHGFMELFQLVSKALMTEGHLACLDGLIFDQYGRRSFRN